MFLYDFALKVLLFDHDICEQCRKHCHCPDYQDTRLHRQQVEAVKRIKAAYRDPSPPGIDVWRGREFGGGRGARVGQKKTRPIIPIPRGRIPQVLTLNANENRRAVLGLGKIGMA
jgi:hypothetical protein